MRQIIRTALLIAVGVGAITAPANAATTVGQTAPTAGDIFNCGGGSLFLTPSVAPGSPSYEVPTPGILTSWSAQGGTLPDPPPLELKLLRPTAPNTWEIVAEDPIARSIPLNVVSSFDVQIPVNGGEFLALWAAAGAGYPCSYDTIDDSNLQVWRGGGPHPEPGVGQTFLTDMTDISFRTNVSAVVEADCDGDGLGDETQDPDTASCTPDTDPPDTDPPETTITKGAPNKTSKSKVKFKFSSNEAGATFECKKDRKPWKSCTSPTEMKRLDEGKHKFKVRATDPAGNTGKAAKDKFKVVDGERS